MSTHQLCREVRSLSPYIDFSRLEHRPCICGGQIYHFSAPADDQWICDLCCGAAGASYEEALREKIKLNFGQLVKETRSFLNENSALCEPVGVLLSGLAAAHKESSPPPLTIQEPSS